jgi:hypothetical protein
MSNAPISLPLMSVSGVGHGDREGQAVEDLSRCGLNDAERWPRRRRPAPIFLEVVVPLLYTRGRLHREGNAMSKQRNLDLRTSAIAAIAMIVTISGAPANAQKSWIPQTSWTPDVSGGRSFSNGVTSTPNVFGGENFSNGVNSSSNVLGGKDYSNGVTSTPNVMGGYDYSNGVTSSRNVYGGQSYSNGVVCTPSVLGGMDCR